MFRYGIYLVTVILVCMTAGCNKTRTIGTAIANFTGKYKCSGFDPYLNKAYKGSIEITENEVVYDIKMHYDTGETYQATGGQYTDELLFVVFQDTHNLKRVGLEQYELKEDNTIAGYWVYLGQNKLGSEVCVKIQ